MALQSSHLCYFLLLLNVLARERRAHLANEPRKYVHDRRKWFNRMNSTEKIGIVKVSCVQSFVFIHVDYVVHFITFARFCLCLHTLRIFRLYTCFYSRLPLRSVKHFFAQKQPHDLLFIIIIVPLWLMNECISISEPRQWSFSTYKCFEWCSKAMTINVYLLCVQIETEGDLMLFIFFCSVSNRRNISLILLLCNFQCLSSSVRLSCQVDRSIWTKTKRHINCFFVDFWYETHKNPIRHKIVRLLFMLHYFQFYPFNNDFSILQSNCDLKKNLNLTKKIK